MKPQAAFGWIKNITLIFSQKTQSHKTNSYKLKNFKHMSLSHSNKNYIAINRVPESLNITEKNLQDSDC